MLLVICSLLGDEEIGLIRTRKQEKDAPGRVVMDSVQRQTAFVSS